MGIGFDTQSLRVSMNDSGGERRVLLDGVEELMELEVGAGTQVARYDRDPTRVDALLAQVAGGKTHAVTDALGTVYGLTDATGALQARYSYDAYGGRTEAGATTRFGFTGREHDSSTGLTYYRARYYDPRVGRFGARDPRLVTSGENFYGFVENQTTRLTDPTGSAVVYEDSVVLDVRRRLQTSPTGASWINEVVSRNVPVGVASLYHPQALYAAAVSLGTPDRLADAINKIAGRVYGYTLDYSNQCFEQKAPGASHALKVLGADPSGGRKPRGTHESG